MMGRGMGDDQFETISRLRERVAGLDQKMISALDSHNRDLTYLKQHFEEKLDAQREDLEMYIDRKFMEMTITIKSTPTATSVNSRLWLVIVITGLFSAATFIALTIFLISIRNPL